MTLDELETGLWRAVDTLEENGGTFNVRHAARPAGKLRDEIWPTLQFAKFINGQPEAADQRLEVRCNVTDQQTEMGLPFDAQYRWNSCQPRFSDNLSGGYIEVTRWAISVCKERQDDMMLSQGEFPKQTLRDASFSQEVVDSILACATKKSTKTYPKDTALVVSLDCDEASNAASHLRGNEHFEPSIKKELGGKFSQVFICGLATRSLRIDLRDTGGRPTSRRPLPS